MSSGKYRVGQRVRIEWPDGTLVEGLLSSSPSGKPILYTPVWSQCFDPSISGDGRTVTILSEPRPEEPKGLGAVVRARARIGADPPGRVWIRIAKGGERSVCWRSPDFLGPVWATWDNMIDPVVLSEGVVLDD